MKAVIPLRASFANSEDGADVSVTTVVDSGKAHTAVTESVFRQIGGGALEPSQLTFTDIGGERLTCLGRGHLLEFALGDVWLRTAVYVFDKLVEPMLLGASSSVEHGLVVDGTGMLLRCGTAPLQIVPSDSVPLMSSLANKMKDPTQVQILAHRDKRQLCLVDATELANVLSTVNCTTERRKSSTHRQLGRLDRRMPSQRPRNESQSQDDKRVEDWQIRTQ
eukprot:1797354-Pleurochrysis_carterae.AAC.1